jgi:hypothetical protein
MGLVWDLGLAQSCLWRVPNLSRKVLVAFSGPTVPLGSLVFGWFGALLQVPLYLLFKGLGHFVTSKINNWALVTERDEFCNLEVPLNSFMGADNTGCNINASNDWLFFTLFKMFPPPYWPIDISIIPTLHCGISKLSMSWLIFCRRGVYKEAAK